MFKSFDLNNFITLNRLKERKLNSLDLIHLTKFHRLNKNQKNVNLQSIFLNCSFASIDFDKKRIPLQLSFFEILTWQKRYTTKTSKNIIGWDLKKNTFTGLKLTLRSNLYSFLEQINLYLPLLEKPLSFSYKSFKGKKNFMLKIWFNQINKFFPVQNIQDDFFKTFEVQFKFNTYLNEEKLFFLQSLHLFEVFSEIKPNYFLLKN